MGLSSRHRRTTSALPYGTVHPQDQVAVERDQDLLDDGVIVNLLFVTSDVASLTIPPLKTMKGAFLASIVASVPEKKRDESTQRVQLYIIFLNTTILGSEWLPQSSLSSRTSHSHQSSHRSLSPTSHAAAPCPSSNLQGMSVCARRTTTAPHLLGCSKSSKSPRAISSTTVSSSSFTGTSETSFAAMLLGCLVLNFRRRKNAMIAYCNATGWGFYIYLRLSWMNLTLQ